MQVREAEGTLKPKSRIQRAKIYISENLIYRNSWTRALCFICLDIILILGLLWQLNQLIRDWKYWQHAPNSFNMFIFLQYFLMASCVRCPLTTALKNTIVMDIQGILVILLLINTIMGTFWFKQLLHPSSDDNHQAAKNIKPGKSSLFVLKDEYMVQGAVMLGLAWIFFFLGTIVMI